MDRAWRHGLGALMVLGWAALPVAAQDSDASRDTESSANQAESRESDEGVALEQITVTGEKQGRSLQETTSSVRVIDGFELEAHGDQSVADTLDRTGNAVATGRGQFSLRGLNSGGPTAFDLDDEFARPLAAIRVDGVVLDRLGSRFGLTDLFDVSQVEILRGPQSTTQGRSALAGTIVVNTREPTRFWEARTRLQGLYNNDADGGNYQAGLAGGGPITDRTAFRLTGERREDDGNVTNVVRNEDDWDASESNLIRGRVRHDFTDNPDGAHVLATVLYSDGRQGPDRNFEAFGAPRRTSESNFDSFNESDFQLASLEFNLPLSRRFDLTAITGALRSGREGQLDIDGTDQQNERTFLDGEGTTLSQELRLNFDGLSFLGTPVSGLIGAYGGVFDDERDQRVRDQREPVGGALPAPLGSSPIVQDAFVEFDSDGRTERNADNIAVFGEADFALTDKLNVTLGLRYDRESSEAAFPLQITDAELVVPVGGAGLPPAIEQALDDLGLVPDSGLPPLQDGALRLPAQAFLEQGGFIQETPDEFVETTFDAFLPKAAVSYDFSDRLEVFLSYQRAYRAGGAELLVTQGRVNEFDPEFTDNFETGVRATWLGGALQTRLNLFLTEFTDQQVRQIAQGAGGAESFRTNAGESRLVGGELEVDWQVFQGLSAYLSAGVTDTEFTEFVFEGNDLSGNEFVRAPNFSGSLGGVWRPGGGWFVSSSLSHTEEYFLRVENTPIATSDAFTLLNARLGYEAAGWSAFLVGRNLLNDDYATDRIDVRGDPSLNGVFVEYGDLREIGAQVEVFF